MKWVDATLLNPSKEGVYHVRNHCSRMIYEWVKFDPFGAPGWYTYDRVTDQCEKKCHKCERFEWLDDNMTDNE